jgi:hypothetical protein
LTEIPKRRGEHEKGARWRRTFQRAPFLHYLRGLHSVMR